MPDAIQANIAPAPQVVFIPPQPIKIFQVTDEKLSAIKNAASDSSQDLSFMIGSLGIFFTALATLLTSASSMNVFVIYGIVVCVTPIVALYTGLQWYRKRKILPTLIENIMKSSVPA